MKKQNIFQKLFSKFTKVPNNKPKKDNKPKRKKKTESQTKLGNIAKLLKGSTKSNLQTLAKVFNNNVKSKEKQLKKEQKQMQKELDEANYENGPKFIKDRQKELEKQDRQNKKDTNIELNVIKRANESISPESNVEDPMIKLLKIVEDNLQLDDEKMISIIDGEITELPSINETDKIVQETLKEMAREEKEEKAREKELNTSIPHLHQEAEMLAKLGPFQKVEETPFDEIPMLTDEEREIYEEYQEIANSIIDYERFKAKQENPHIKDIDKYLKQDKMPIDAIKTLDQYDKQIAKFQQIMDSEDIFKEYEDNNIQILENVFEKSKYSEGGISRYTKVDGGQAYKDFKHALHSADSQTKLEFFQKYMPQLTTYYQDAYEDGDNYDDRQLAENLRGFTKFLTK